MRNKSFKNEFFAVKFKSYNEFYKLALWMNKNVCKMCAKQIPSHSLVIFLKFQILVAEARSSGVNLPFYGFKRPRITSTSVGIFSATHNIFRSLIFFFFCCTTENKNDSPHDSGHLEFKMYSLVNSAYLWIRFCALKKTPRRPFSMGNFGEMFVRESLRSSRLKINKIK